MMIRTMFTKAELDTMRDSFATITSVRPEMLPRFHKLFDGCSEGGLRQLAEAKINFVSKLAANAQMRRGIR